jgi:SAM-dependent methyltransferase
MNVALPDAAIRRAFLDARRRSHAERLSALAPTYDAAWGEIPLEHAAALEAILAATRPAGTVLDAACGTGRFWSQILASGRTVVGVDQAPGMLEAARAKHPDVPAAVVGLQELAFDAVFDAVICVDAMENVGPEDWPVVLDRLRAAARPGAPVWLTVELAPEAAVRAAFDAAVAAGHPVVPGEDFDGVGYHYYPSREQVRGWLAEAGLVLEGEAESESYWHLRCCCPVAREAGDAVPTQRARADGRSVKGQEAPG